MQLSISFLLGLVGLVTAAPAEEAPAAVPSSCSAYLSKTKCYTHTLAPKPTLCPNIFCPPKDGLVCPLIISIVQKNVPCSTDCCPKTKTVTPTVSCTKCVTGCVIPTITETVTTGCKTTKTATLPTITRI